ncbi:hypothetical protein A2863_02065 [Candidatus Woesebacteria bacterium RIFCSPHIGHO2_01_FULL_38_9b]|nr:MAG: hypothetical protein A2863_02065 [Candidatus Woesebacteria bacterium RIFCSPHIGHO2_01_FULL_38_9b]
MKIQWEKIDKFYLVLVAILILMAALVIITFKSVFSAYLVAYELKQSDLESSVNVNEEKLDEAHKYGFQKQTIPLEVR